MNYFFKNSSLIIVSFYLFSCNIQAELTPLLFPVLDHTTNKYKGKSVIADSIDNQTLGHQFRDRTYYYDLALDSNGKAYVLYAQPKPLTPNSSSPVDFTKEKSDIILAIESETGWQKQILTTEGVFQPTAIQIKVDNNDTIHLTYIRKLIKEFSGSPQEVDYLIYRKIENNIVSEEIEVGDLDANPANFAGLGSWRTFLAIAPDNSVYMIREGGNEELTQGSLNLLIPNEKGNWDKHKISGLPTTNWYRIGKFLIDKSAKPHIIFADYAYDHNAKPYASTSYFDIDHNGFHNLWYASSTSLDGKNWSAHQFDETPNNHEPALNNFQFWPDLALDEKNNPAVATWLWRSSTRFPGYDTSTVFFQRDSSHNWTSSQTTTRIFNNLTYRPNGQLAGMGAGLVKDPSGWHGVWDSSHPRPFEHDFLRGGIMYRYSPDGKDWANYQPIAEFSAEGFCIVKIDNQNRLNILVLGDHTDTQLYLLRYQLPNNKLMEVYPDRHFYYSGESVTLNARVQPGAEGDFYVAVISSARPEIKQKPEIWQLTSNYTWQKIPSIENLQPLLTFPAGTGFNFNGTIGTVNPNQPPFDKKDTDYTIYSLVTKSGSNVFDGQWVTPLSTQTITANKSLPK